MIFLEAIAQELQDKELGTIGESIFVYRMNEDIQNGILLTERLTGSEIYDTMPDYRTTRFNVIVRGVCRKDTIKLSHKISKELKTVGDRQLGSILFKYIHIETDPRVFPISEGDFLESLVVMKTNFVITDYEDYES